MGRVCAIRQVDAGNDLMGPYSSLLVFCNPVPTVESISPSKSHVSSSFTSNFSTAIQVRMMIQRCESFSLD